MAQPQSYVVMLRGVNVGGKNKLPSAVLKAACESAGFENVRTYLQSGNVVFTAAAKPDAVLKQLQTALKTASGLTVALILRSAADLRKLTKKPPFADMTNGSRIVVAFLDGTLPAAMQTKLRALAVDEEQLKFGKHEVFAHFPNGMGRSRLANALHDKSLGVPCTVRNWNTVTALQTLSEALNPRAA